MKEVAPEEWAAVLEHFPDASILQSGTWGELKERWGWQPRRLVWPGHAAPAAAVQVLTRPLPAPFGRYQFAYAPHGPLLPPVVGARQWGEVLGGLESWARQAAVGVMKVELDVDAKQEETVAALREYRWRPSHEAIQFPNTMVTDLEQGAEGLLHEMKPKTRYNIRLAKRRGVVVRRTGAEGIEPFLTLYAETARRDGFAIRTGDYYRDVWQTLITEERAEILLAELDGQALAGVMPVVAGSTTFYMYGASGSEGRQLMPAYAAQWDSLLWAIERGSHRYDWWGGPSRLDDSDPLWGVYRFKSGFGARLHERLGPWDLAVSPGPYLAYRFLTAARRWLLRRR